MLLRPGDVVSHYRVKRLLRADDSVLYEVYDARTGNPFVLKLPNGGSAQIDREFDVLPQLDHPSIIRLSERLMISAHKAIVLPYAEGGDLFEYIEATGPMCERDAKDTFWRMLSALDYLHRQGRWHGDIKLENMLLLTPHFDPNQVVLCDFGFSCNFEAEHCSNSFVGTIFYSPPELVTASIHTEKADIWSLGISLFAALNGGFPFETSGDIDGVRNEIRSGLPDLFAYGRMAEISRSAADLIRAMLEPDAEYRVTAEGAMNHPWFFDVRKPDREGFVDVAEQGMSRSRSVMF
jgi:serine/threonine protein kinase